MTQRFKDAQTAQNGACNPRPIANALVNAIDECRAEGVDPTEDPAVFLILHQLAYVLTDLDLAASSMRGAIRYVEDMGKLTTALKED